MDTMYKVLLITIPLIFSIVLVTAQNQDEPPRCYRFTWLGPSFHNGSQFLNSTCRSATNLASGIPCEMPLVASYDGTWPDVKYIWKYHKANATCIPVDNVCAQYTYYFNGLVLNSTYMCTRAIDANNTAITSGCYEESRGSFTTRVCFCQSVGGVRPCNSAAVPFITPLMAVIVIFICIINNHVR